MVDIDRKLDPRLKKLYGAGKQVFSFSKLSTIEQCLYAAYLSYILRQKGESNVYSVLGGRVHDTLQAIMDGAATEKELLPAINETLKDLETLGMEFPKLANGEDKIRTNWVNDMTHFAKTFVKPKGEFTTEELLLLKIDDDHYLQGYSDLIRHNKDGTKSIYDWKSSSMYKGEDLDHAGKQLVLYAMALEAAGETVKNIAWIFLKYVEVTFEGKLTVRSKKRKPITKVLNRGKIMEGLRGYIEDDFEFLGYSKTDADIMMSAAMKNNDFNLLPEDIKALYHFKPYVLNYELSDRTRNETLQWMKKQIQIFEEHMDKPGSEWQAREMYKVFKNGNRVEDTFFCNCLCDHRSTCGHIKSFNNLKELGNDEDLF